MRNHKKQFVEILADYFSTAKVAKPRMVEVGVYTGIVSAAVLRAFPKLHLYMVDPWEWFGDAGPYAMSFRMLDAIARTEFAAKRRTLMRQKSLEAARLFGKRELDVVYLDGDHTYKSVRADIKAWWPRVRIGGLLCGHDYDGHPIPHLKGIRRAVDEFGEASGRPVTVHGTTTIWSIRKE